MGTGRADRVYDDAGTDAIDVGGIANIAVGSSMSAASVAETVGDVRLAELQTGRAAVAFTPGRRRAGEPTAPRCQRYPRGEPQSSLISPRPLRGISCRRGNLATAHLATGQSGHALRHW